MPAQNQGGLSKEQFPPSPRKEFSLQPRMAERALTVSTTESSHVVINKVEDLKKPSARELKGKRRRFEKRRERTAWTTAGRRSGKTGRGSGWQWGRGSGSILTVLPGRLSGAVELPSSGYGCRHQEMVPPH